MRANILLIGCGLLAACGESGEGTNKAQSGSAATGSNAAGPQIQPGQWEMTLAVTRMEAPGVPAGAMPMPGARTIRQCFTQEELTSGGMFKADPATSVCESNTIRFEGGRVTGAMRCTGSGTTTEISIDGSFTPTSWTARQRIQTGGQGSNMVMEADVSARRIGDCPEGGAG